MRSDGCAGSLYLEIGLDSRRMTVVLCFWLWHRVLAPMRAPRACTCLGSAALALVAELVSRMLVSTPSGQGIGFGGLPSKSKSSLCSLDRAPACLPVAMSHTFT